MPERNLPTWMRLLSERPPRSEMDRIGQPGGSTGLSLPGGLPALPVPPLGPSEADAPLPPWQYEALVAALWRQAAVFMQPFTVGTTAILLRPAENRKYLFLQNQSATQNMALGLNQPPGPLTGSPVSGLVILSNFGFYEPLVVPQGEIWIIAAAAATPGILLYSA